MANKASTSTQRTKYPTANREGERRKNLRPSGRDPAAVEAAPTVDELMASSTIRSACVVAGQPPLEVEHPRVGRVHYTFVSRPFIRHGMGAAREGQA
jgi:hypothetical protein